MNCHRFFLLPVIAILFSCAEKLNTRSNESFEHSEISLEKTPCYGRCPVYKITIYGTGKVVFVGKKNTDRVGVYEKHLTQSEVVDLFSAYELASFFDFRQEYTSKATDLPTTFIYYKNNKGFEKKIKDRQGAPEELKQLEKLVEEIAKSKEGWKKQ